MYAPSLAPTGALPGEKISAQSALGRLSLAQKILRKKLLAWPTVVPSPDKS